MVPNPEPKRTSEIAVERMNRARAGLCEPFDIRQNTDYNGVVELSKIVLRFV